MSFLRKVEMSHSLPKIRAWRANFGLGDDEQARLTTDRSVDGGSGWQPHDGLSGSGAGRERSADATAGGEVSGWCGAALIHMARGRTATNRFKVGVRDYALELVRQNYRDFGPTLAAEVLLERHGVEVSRETLRKWMAEAGLWLSRRQRRTFHQPRLRRESYGELVQIDGSEHRWFEDRAEPCTLLVFIDDATT